MSLFSAVEMAPRDPILGLNEAFNADTRPNKVNLGVGVYYNEEGRIPLLRAVVEAEHAASPPTRRAATCRSKASPLTMLPYRSCCSATILR
jgi:aspartate/tyrosine/aromatic aminotransferase